MLFKEEQKIYLAKLKIKFKALLTVALWIKTLLLLLKWFFLTIGQYLQPSEKHHPLDRYYKPEEFDELKFIAESKGFLLVSSSPLTRSSYHADEDFTVLKKNRINQANAQSIS